MASSPGPTTITPSNGYRLWAESYDTDANPMLSLEERVLAPLLPSMDGLNVVDLGCGTGRWLDLLRSARPANLVGVDLSPEMLNQAKGKLGEAATLICLDYTDAPIPQGSADVVLSNFVLSYVDAPDRFLQFARKVLKSGGLLFLTDVHPETATALRWKRGGRAHGGFQEIRAYNRPIPQIIRLCEDAGLEVQVQKEPRFGTPERMLFERNGKGDYFESIVEHPAIYVLRLAAIEKRPGQATASCAPTEVTTLLGARFAFGPAAAVQGEIRVGRGVVEEISVGGEAKPPAPADRCIDLRGCLVLPGLINAHDHLEFALFPRMGTGNYRNFLEWAEDIHRSHAGEIARHRQVPKRVRLWWGGIRNVLCGVTTVCHHNSFDREVFTKDFIVRVLEDYGWAHSPAVESAAAQKKRETPAGQKFFIHLAEGIDEQSREEIWELSKEGALDADTIVIHGLGMGIKGGALLRAAQAGLVWCPSSNLFLFGTAMPADDIRRFPKVALGSDSPLSADGDLLDEVRCALLKLHMPAVEVYEYVTQRAADLVGLKTGEGLLKVGGVADVIVVRDRGMTPAETLATLTYRDIDLVLVGGRVQLASQQVKDRLPFDAGEGLELLDIEGTLRWIRAPLQRLFAETTAHLGSEIYMGGRRVHLGN
jgi:cytosine/adenosine deaminase-related metal-dependent hydrolase/SAM-dependent methyltransferase